MSAENIIEARDLRFIYNGILDVDPALDGVTLDVAPGECVMLVGPSGCGKTTFSRMLNGLSPAFFAGELSGVARSCGLMAGEAAIEDYVPLVGSVFQNPKTQYFNVNTTSELAFPCENSGMEPGAIRERVAEVAREYGLEGLLDRSIFKLSGGEKQRIAFGAACMLGPRLLVLDEPTSNLDAAAIDDLHDLVARIKAQGVTVVIAEHRLAWAADLADRWVLFEGGRVAGSWTSDEFRALGSERLAHAGLRALDLASYRESVANKSQLKPSGELLVSIEHAVIGYGKKNPVRAVEGFELAAGEVVALMGSNGCGKSTLARTLCGLIRPIEGEVLLHGRPAKPRELTRASFLVMQDVNYQLFSDSVREEVLLGARKPEEVDEVLEVLGLTELAERHPMSLSGGQKQRVAVASAMLAGKELVVLDEPTSGLDRGNMERVGRLLRQLADRGTCVLVITHDDELAATACDRVVRLDDALSLS